MSLSTTSESFLSHVDSWIAEGRELLVLVRHDCRGGAKDWRFVDSADAFKSLLATYGRRTSVIVFRQPQLPLRGRVNEKFIQEALAIHRDEPEWCLVGLDPTSAGAASWYYDSAGDTREQLLEDLNDHLGERMAFGSYPPWLVDSEDVISAIVPDEDGAVRPGTY